MERPLKSKRSPNGQFEVYDKNTDLVMVIDAILIDEKGVKTFIDAYNKHPKYVKDIKKLQKEVDKKFMNGYLEFGGVG
jgi:hypothetical protein